MNHIKQAVTVDMLDKASAGEMENVGITSLSAGYMAAIAKEYQANEMMDIIYNAAMERFDNESRNTVNHYAWTMDNNKDIEAELALESEILDALKASYITKTNQLLTDAKAS
ncbi:MAG TPA: hypothetical protein VM577_19590 [Anaerovoracaceae bacterium]|nr:hypothetical protein [Anaerovoracaceae bacterium]